jgi:hypothetical protein
MINRKLKFRIFYENEMYPCDIQMDGSVIIFRDDTHDFWCVGNANGSSSLLVDAYPMQYIGSEDIKNVEIYEGDIIKMNIDLDHEEIKIIKHLLTSTNLIYKDWILKWCNEDDIGFADEIAKTESLNTKIKDILDKLS